MLDECIQEFMFKPESQRCLYEIRIASQPPLVTEVLSVEQIVELLNSLAYGIFFDVNRDRVKGSTTPNPLSRL